MRRFSVPPPLTSKGAGSLLALALAACAANTELTGTWKPEDFQPVSATGKRIATVFITDNATQRHAGEDALAQELARLGVTGVPSYTIVNDLDAYDPARARSELAGAHVDGAVVIRVLGITRQVFLEPGYWTIPYYRSFWGYWDNGWRAAVEPAYLPTDTAVRAETLVYSLQPDRLLWAAASETFDPTSVRSAVKQIARHVADRLDEDSVLVP